MRENETIRRRVPVLWQPRQPVFWLWAVLAVLSTILLCFDIAARVSGLAGFIAAILLVGVQTVLLRLIVRAMPRFHRQSRSLQLAAIVWGGFVAIGIAGFLNTFDGAALRRYGIESLDAALTAPVNEDTLRTLGIVVVLVLVGAGGRRITVMDGVVYGFLVGSGFEVVENLTYALGSTDLGGTLVSGVQRLLVGFALHALWSTGTGAALAYCVSRAQRGLRGRWLLLIPAMLVPALFHAAWDSPPISVLGAAQMLMFALVYALTLVMFFSAVAWGRRSEFAWFAETTGSALERRRFAKLPRGERRALAAAAVERDALEEHAAAAQSEPTAVGDPDAGEPLAASVGGR